MRFGLFTYLCQTGAPAFRFFRVLHCHLNRVIRGVLVAGGLSLAGLTPAGAGPLSDLAGAIETAGAKGDQTQLITLTQQLRAQAWKAAPFSFRQALFTETKAAGFGRYAKRANNTFTEGQTVHIYLEPYGFAFARQDGQYRYDLQLDYVLLSENGQILTSKKDVLRAKASGPAMASEVYLDLSFTIAGFVPGRYVLAFTLRDQDNKESQAVKLPFEIAAKPDADKS